MKITKNIYKKLTILTQQVLQKLQIPLYAKKFSKKDFTTYQLLTLLILKTFEKKGYRAFIDFLHASKIPKWLDLKKIPHFSTLQKFAKRLQINFLESLLMESSKVTKPCKHAAIDATGLSFRNPSRHYERRVGIIIKKKDFFKLCFIADMDNQLIHAAKLRKKSRHDTKDFIPLWNKVKHLPFHWFYMDRGYDDDRFHQMIFDANKVSFGCLKNLNVPIHRTKGTARKKVKTILKHKKKGWRSLIETMNGVIKQKFGSTVYAKTLHTQKVETFIKMVTYNLYRISIKNLKFAVLLISILIDNLKMYFQKKLRFSLLC